LRVEVEKEENGVASGRLIIESIVEAMMGGLEELYTKTIAPELFQVYLHASDYHRLEGVFRELQEEAATALDQRIERLNRALERGPRRGLATVRRWIAQLPIWRLAGLTSPGEGTEARRVAKPRNGWQITFNRNEDPEANPGDIVIDAVLMLPPRVEFGAGMTTRSVRTIIRGDLTGQRSGPASRVDTQAETRLVEPVRSSPEGIRSAPSQTSPITSDSTRPAAGARALLCYRDQGGARSYEMTRRAIVIGRGGTGVWTDIKLATGTDVSREHLRIREDGGQYFLKDVSSLGTSIDGISVPGSMVKSGNQLIDRDIWVPLPAPSRISLAGVIEIEFSLVKETA
jgi:hypothetical protein